MRATHSLVGVGLVMIAIFGVLVWLLPPAQPTYNGRSLDSWLEEWSHSDYDRTDPAAAAIKAIGTNGLPLLLNRLSQEESPMRNLLRAACRSIRIKLSGPISRQLGAAEAINLLGADASAALPVLTNLMSNRRYQMQATIALAGIGHDGVAVLIQTLTNRDWSLREVAAGALAEARSDFDEVIPALIETIKAGVHDEHDDLIRGAAGDALVRLQKKPEIVVPALSQLLVSSPESDTREFAARLLGGFGSDAKTAVPLLLQALTDKDKDVRDGARQALNNIDPQAAVSPAAR